MNANDHYTTILLEDMNRKFDLVIELVYSMKEEMKTLAKQKDLDEVKQEVKLIHLALTETNREVRIKTLEKTVFRPKAA